MKLLCGQNDLTRALNIVSKAISTRTTIPILKGILLEASEGKLSLSASDLEISVETSIEADVKEPGAIVLQAKLFGDIARKLPGGDVLMETLTEDNIRVSSLGSEFTLTGDSPDEFPRLPDARSGDHISIDAELFRDMIRRTCFAASLDETRGVITGVLSELRADSFNMVALDGFRMALVRRSVKNAEERDILISARIMNELGKILSDESEKKSGDREEGETEKKSKTKKAKDKKDGDEDRADEENAEKNAAANDEGVLSVLLDDKKAVFGVGRTKIVTRLIEGKFINYADITPKEHKTDVILAKSDLTQSVERASILIREGKNNFIKVRVTDGLMTITSRAEEGTIKEEIAADKRGDDLEIGFNARYMSDVLRAVPDEEIRMEFNTAVTPCVIRPLEGDAYEYLILPIRLSTGS